MKVKVIQRIFRVLSASGMLIYILTQNPIVAIFTLFFASTSLGIMLGQTDNKRNKEK